MAEHASQKGSSENCPMVIMGEGERREHLSTLEKYHICNMNKNNLHMNYTNTDTHSLTIRALKAMNIS
jgi:hypothetical protein